MNREAWLKAVASVSVKDYPDAITTQEFSAITGLKETAAKMRLRMLVEKGTAKRVHKYATDTAGRRQLVTAYLLA